MKRIIAFLVLVGLFVNLMAQESSVKRLTVPNLHTRIRTWPYPANGVMVPTNAPALLWPATNGKERLKYIGDIGDVAPEDPYFGKVLYKVILAKDKSFTKNIIESGIQHWAMYPLHQALEPGLWYWKYAYKIEGADTWIWSQVYDFAINPVHQHDPVSPAVEEVIKRNEGAHPRLWDMRNRSEEFYENNRSNPEALKFIAFAEKLMDEPLPLEKPRKYIDTVGKTELQKAKIVEAMYHGFGDMVGTPVRNLCMAYQLTKDKRFIEDAKRRALHIARMDPNGLATRDDFTGGAVLEAIAWFYDVGYPFLDENEKKLFRDVIRLHGNRIYKHLPNRFEVNINDNHVWQITLRNLAIGAVPVIGELPEAKEWLTYIYEVWTARFPILGNTDGGWHEGSGYFKVNFRSFIYLSQMLGDLSGVDYFKLPWMQNLPYFLLYTHPSNASCMAIGDMWEREPGISKIDAWFADALTYKIDNPYLNQYVKRIRNDYPHYFNGTDDLLLFRLLHYNPQRRLKQHTFKELPKSRLFPDVGIVAMHEDLDQAEKGLSSYFVSSPLGASGHGHAFQNAFTVNYKGKTIFGGTGYYSNFSDRHNLLDYRSSRAYSTVLVDSLGQKIGEEGYGWLPRFLTGNHIQYVMGDASQAYGDIKNDFWLDRFKQINVLPNKANGYGDAGVTLYRRHMLQLEGGYIILYDELEAKRPVKWTSQFQVPYCDVIPKVVDPAKHQRFDVNSTNGFVSVDVFADEKVNMMIHNIFAEPAVNWNNVTGPDGKVIRYKNQWHVGLTSLPKEKFRYLSILQLKDTKLAEVKCIENKAGSYSFSIGDWVISAQLDGNQPAVLQVRNEKIKALFNYGNIAASLDRQSFVHQQKGSSMLVEQLNGKMLQKESMDELPQVAKYDFN